MATSNKKEENGAVLNEEEQHPNEVKVEQPTVTRSCSVMNTITPLIAIAALIIAGYTYYANYHLNQSVTEENQQLSGVLHQLQQQQSGFEQHINTKANEQQKAHHAVEQKIANVTKQMQILSNKKGNQNQDWLLLKARYYLELAQINAHWSSEANALSTIELLQQADTILGQINTPELFKIRQTIAKEIMSLKTADTIDVPGLLSQLDALQNSISQLNAQTTSNFNVSSNTKEEKAPSNKTSWSTYLHDSLNKLSKLVVIRRNDEEIKPLLSPVYESVLKESIRLNIQEAQWAIIHTNPVAYQLALSQAIATLKKGFNEHLSNTTTLINQLTKLQKVQLNQQKPEIGQALPLLNRLIEQKQITKPEEHNNNKEQEL